MTKEQLLKIAIDNGACQGGKDWIKKNGFDISKAIEECPRDLLWISRFMDFDQSVIDQCAERAPSAALRYAPAYLTLKQISKCKGLIK